MPQFENAQCNIIASKERADAAAGLRDVLHADAQFFRGEIGLGETVNRTTSGLSRVVSGTIGNFLYSRSSDGASDYDGVLPGLEISEQGQSMCPEDNIRQLKKEQSAYQQEQSPYQQDQADTDSDAGAVRQAKKEKSSYLDTQSIGMDYE